MEDPIIINLYDLMSVSRQQMLKEGGTYIETLNQNEDGVCYIPVSLSEQVNETLSKQPLGEKI